MLSALDPDAARLLESWAAAASGPVETQPVAALRSSGLINAEITGPAPFVARVENRVVVRPGASPIPVRVYQPGSADGPVLVYAHGGGWTLLSVDACDTLCRHIAAGASCTVVSVDYRLAPEHPFPAAFDDIWETLEWVASGGVGWSPSRLAVGGDSAGGNLAAACSIHARSTDSLRIDLQVLLYPATSTDLDTPSMRTLGPDPRFRLSQPTMQWFWSNYLGGATTTDDPRAAPAAESDLTGLPHAIVVTPGFDPLKDDGRQFATRLAAAGNIVELVEPASLPHGFAMMLGAVPAGRPVFDDIVTRIRSVMHQSPQHTKAPSLLLAAEFRRRPFGHHSEDLQQLLHLMRSQPIAGKHFLFISDTNQEWVLGRYSDDSPPVPGVDWSTRFSDLESAEWHVFKLRWQALFGETLPDTLGEEG
jgi:acetyl esterase